MAFFVAADRRARLAQARPRDELPQPCMQKRAHAKLVKIPVGCVRFQLHQTSTTCKIVATQNKLRGRANAGMSGVGEMGKIHAHVSMETGEQIDLAPPARLNSGDKKPVEMI